MPEICRVIEEAKYTTRERRVNRTKPQPWLVRKLMVGITFGIMVYTGYVYIGRFFVDIIRRRTTVVGRGAGIAMLVVFCILYLWMLWAYAKVVLTPPGFARDYVSQSPPPMLPPRNSVPVSDLGHSSNNHDSIGGPSYEEISSSDHHIRPPPSYDTEAGVLNAIPRPNTAAVPIPLQPSMPNTSTPLTPSDRPKDGGTNRLADRQRQRIEHDLEKAAKYNLARRPPTIPVLLPEHRYCSRDQFVKPFRAHHCRICGTCVLKYDHHCPWIGQCVGARNHKFFINFNLATAVFTAYTFATLLAFTIIRNSSGDIDVQEIVIIALSALFCIFTFALLMSHMRLLSLSQSTVESLQYRTIAEREDHMLAEAFGMCAFPSKKRVQKAWDQE